ncbi:hypothetical protein ACZ91_56500 [Streptomyces regensis]|nr:hypothetical protein ACZ91_56500 [Streptomyces regensis]
MKITRRPTIAPATEGLDVQTPVFVEAGVVAHPRSRTQPRVDAARDIVADDPTIITRVREYLVDALLPYAAQLRIALPNAAPLPSTA